MHEETRGEGCTIYARVVGKRFSNTPRPLCTDRFFGSIRFTISPGHRLKLKAQALITTWIQRTALRPIRSRPHGMDEVTPPSRPLWCLYSDILSKDSLKNRRRGCVRKEVVEPALGFLDDDELVEVGREGGGRQLTLCFRSPSTLTSHRTQKIRDYAFDRQEYGLPAEILDRQSPFDVKY